MFHNDNLYPSSRYLLLANPKLIAGGHIEKMITLLNQKARRTKAKGEAQGLSLDGVSAEWLRCFIVFNRNFMLFILSE